MPRAAWTLPLLPPQRTDSAAASLLTAIEGLVPTLRERARETERLARVPEANIEGLKRIGFFELMRPKAYGGHEAWFDVLFQAVVEVAKGCASTAWCVGQAGVNQWMLSCADPEAQDDVWGVDPQASICASYAPAVLAETVSDGWSLTGKFGWASGCDNASWVFCGAVLRPGHGVEKPTAALLLLPMHQCRILDDWDVVGLAGTGSKTLLLDKIIVPRHRLVLMPESLAGDTMAARANPRARQALPMLAVLPPILAAAGIGAALGALQASIAATRDRSPSGGLLKAGAKVAEAPTVQMKIATAAAAIDAAQALLLRDLQALGAEVQAGRPIGREQRIVARRNHGFAVLLMQQSIDASYAALGASGLQMAGPVQRAWRDVHAVSRHVNLSWDMVSQTYGQMVLGLEPRGLY